MNTTRDQIDAESRKDPERLEREIDQQRDTIGNIVSALENKLSPGEIVDRVMRAGKGTGSAIETGGVVGALVLGTMGYGVGAMAKNAVSVVKANPVPALLASTGLVWLYASRQDTAPVHQPGYAQGRTAYGSSASMYSTADYGGSSSEGLRDKASHLRDAASERASHLREGVSERASHLREGVSERASHLREGASHLRENVAHKLSDARERVGETAHHTADTVRHQADRAREGFSHMMEDKPLVVGAIALGIGALLGAALPVTRKEDELMGETGDKLRSKAGEAGQTVREKGREVAQSVREKGGESAREIRESARGDSAGSGQSHAGSSSATLGSSGASGTSGLSGTTSPGTTGSPRNTI